MRKPPLCLETVHPLCHSRKARGRTVKTDDNKRSTTNSKVTLEQDAFPGVDVKKSFLHLEHINDPLFEENMPSEQLVQIWVLVFALYVPAGQLVHCITDVFPEIPGLKVPARHALHKIPSIRYSPGEQ